jgi:negative regulator of flagellin synthesis FlgM
MESAMNVNNLSDKPISTVSAGTAKPAEKTASSSASNSQAEVSASVSVQLSDVTQTMTKGVARTATDVFNAEKVQAIRTAIENGSFSVNAEAIADKMLSNARDMLGVASAH